MNLFKVLVLSLILLFPSILAEAQPAPRVKNPPISMETMGGTNAFFYQMVIDKKFQSAPRLGFFSVTNFQPEWGQAQMRDYMVQANLTYRLIENLDVAGGFIWDPVRGIHGTAALKYGYANRKWLVVVSPRVDLEEDPGLEGLVLVEYKPRINETLSFYSRAQALYNHDTGMNAHARSYIMLRAGLTYKDITFGVGDNFDWYGPMKVYKNNLGLFVQIDIF